MIKERVKVRAKASSKENGKISKNEKVEKVKKKL